MLLIITRVAKSVIISMAKNSELEKFSQKELIKKRKIFILNSKNVQKWNVQTFLQ